MSESTLTLRPPVWALLLAVAIGGSFYLYGKHIEVRGPSQNPMTISVAADAKVSATPDIAWLSFGVSTGRQSTAKQATEMVKTTMDKVLAATRALGIEEKDITTESFWLSPEYDYTDGRQVPRGFQATQSLRVKVRDLDKVGDVLSAVTAAGANQAGGITFTVDNPDGAKAEAREKAIAKAKEKAKTLAANLGMSLGRMVGFSEDGGYAPMPMMAKGYGMGGGAEVAADALQIPAGEQEIASTVTLVYELR